MSGRQRLRGVRLRVTNAAEAVREVLAWRPRIVRRWDAGIGEIARTAGLRERDVLFLAGANVPVPEFPIPWILRAAAQRLMRLRTILRRLEQHGYVEPGWRVGHGYVQYVTTELGERAGRAVDRALGIEPYPGEPVRHQWWER